MATSWNGVAEQTVATALGYTPAVGGILSALVFILWPADKTDVWAEMEKNVEALLNKKFSERVKQQVAETLEGLRDASDLYITAVHSKDEAAAEKQWFATRTLYVATRSYFQSQGYERLLLPLFTQYANMRLSLVRDGVLSAERWNWSDAYKQVVGEELTRTIKDFDDYVARVYEAGLEDVRTATKKNYKHCQPFRSVNAYVREMTLTVLDFQEMWKYFDATMYPSGAKVVHTREIFSDPVGSCDDSGDIVLRSAPTQPIAEYAVWSDTCVRSAEVIYPAGGGPGGVTKTDRMGDPDAGGADYVVENVTENPVTIAGGRAGHILDRLVFVTRSGLEYHFGFTSPPHGDPFEFSYPDEIMSRIHINGRSSHYHCADSAVFGFKFAPDREPSDVARRVLFASHPDAPAADPVPDPLWAEDRRRFRAGIAARTAAARAR